VICKKYSAGIAIGLSFVLAYGILFGQAPDEVLKTVVFVSKAKVLSGDMLKLALQIKIKKKWHVHANRLADEFLVPTTLTIEPQEGFEVLETIYPKPKLGKYDYSETPLEVFEGDVLIGALLQIAPGLSPGLRQLKARFKYQACDNQGCLPPKTIDIMRPVEIVAEGPPSRESYPEIFNKITFTKLR
jgi:DsbC/DsbD-like thiol-disulfide interchange protein